jgi:hypothetical protein
MSKSITFSLLEVNIKLSMGIVLFLVAVILFIPLTVINFFCVLWKYRIKWSTINGFFHETAIDIDRFGNRNFRTLLNLTLQNNGYQFGNINETISSALGKNKRDNTLTKVGLLLCYILDSIDENHCIKSIQE